MTKADYDKMFEHAHDGITEYDNPLPGWWTWLFVLSVVFSVAYVGWYHIGVGPSVHDAYEREVVRHLERQLANVGEIAGDDRTIVRLMSEHGDMIAAMGGMFRGNCAQCHRADGGGDIGPNLTDEHWKNVKRPADIFTVISEGVPGTAMTSWKQRFREPQIILLSAYVAAMRGTEPASPKEPEGDRIDPWPTLEELQPGDEPAGDAEPQADASQGRAGPETPPAGSS